MSTSGELGDDVGQLERAGDFSHRRLDLFDHISDREQDRVVTKSRVIG